MWLKLLKEYKGQAPNTIVEVADESAAKTIIELGYGETTQDPTQNTVEALMKANASRLQEAWSQMIQNTLDEAVAQARKKGGEKLTDGKRAGEWSFGAWLRGVASKDTEFLTKNFEQRFIQADGTIVQAKAAMSTVVGTQGGYLVPTPYHAQIMRIAAERAIVRGRATIIPMSSRSIQIPALDITTAPTAGDTSFFGGLVARWTEEAASMTETEPTFKQIELVAHELSGYSKASNQLLADNAVGLEALLIHLFGSAIAWHEDYAFIRGDGVGKPLGFSSSNALITIADRQTNNSFTLADAAGMLAKLLPGWNPASTVWIVSPSVQEKLIQIGDSAGNAIWIPNARDPLPMTLFGIPVAVSEKLPALGTTKDVLLADLSHYLIGDRMGLEIAASEHVGFTTNQMTWRFVHRVDGQPWLRSSITLSDASSTVGPFITLPA